MVIVALTILTSASAVYAATLYQRTINGGIHVNTTGSLQVYNMDETNCTYLNFGSINPGDRSNLNVTVANTSNSPIWLKVDNSISLIDGFAVRIRFANSTLLPTFTYMNAGSSLQVWIIVTTYSYCRAGDYTFTVTFTGCSTSTG